MREPEGALCRINALKLRNLALAAVSEGGSVPKSLQKFLQELRSWKPPRHHQQKNNPMPSFQCWCRLLGSSGTSCTAAYIRHKPHCIHTIFLLTTQKLRSGVKQPLLVQKLNAKIMKDALEFTSDLLNFIIFYSLQHSITFKPNCSVIFS